MLSSLSSFQLSRAKSSYFTDIGINPFSDDDSEHLQDLSSHALQEDSSSIKASLVDPHNDSVGASSEMVV